MTDTRRVAAIQLAVRVADTAHNLAACARLAETAVREGARWIALPEFFNTGVSFEPALRDAIATDDGEPSRFLRDVSARHNVVIGGSFLCRLPDGRVRNRYQCWADGALLGRHDKDLPTMWENAFYEGGEPGDDGVLGVQDGLRVGTAVCWEFMRTQTARRLQGRVDLLIGGSCWWSIPDWIPAPLRMRWEARNAANALGCVQDTARLLGVPVLHAAHCGDTRCAMPGLPLLRYRGHYEGHAAIIGADGQRLAHRDPAQGEGLVIADVPVAARADTRLPAVPQRYWLRDRGVMPAFAWHQQRLAGRRWYARHVRG